MTEQPDLVLCSSKTKKKMSPCPSLCPVFPQAQNNEKQWWRNPLVRTIVTPLLPGERNACPVPGRESPFPAPGHDVRKYGIAQ